MVPDNQNSNMILPNVKKKIIWESLQIGSSVFSRSFANPVTHTGMVKMRRSSREKRGDEEGTGLNIL